MPPTIPTQEELRDREFQILEETATATAHLPAGHRLAEQFVAIAKDRAERWATFVAACEVPDGIKKWAADMALVHGPKVKIRRTVLSWIEALYVVRYGEAEYYWPETLTDGDFVRALAWQHRGNIPDGVTYIVAEG